MFAYDTTILRHEQSTIERILSWVRERTILGSEDVFNIEGSIWTVSHEVEDLPQWSHPILDPSTGKVYIDTRAMRNREGMIGNQLAYNDILDRGRLEAGWAEHHSDFQSMDPIVSVVMGVWLGNTISSNFSLEGPETELLTVLSRAYGIILMMSADEVTNHGVDGLKGAILGSIVRNAPRVPRQYAIGLVEEQFMQNFFKACIAAQGGSLLPAYVDAIGELVTSIRLGINTTDLLTALLEKSWAGNLRKELTGLAVEHPPTLLFMIRQASEIGAFRKTRIGSAVDAAKRMGVKTKAVVPFVGGWETSAASTGGW